MPDQAPRTEPATPLSPTEEAEAAPTEPASARNCEFETLVSEGLAVGGSRAAEAASEESPSSNPRRVAVGSDFGPFRVLTEIGRGGMGAVYLAQESETERMVALKVTSPRLLENAAAVNCFERDAISNSVSGAFDLDP